MPSENVRGLDPGMQAVVGWSEGAVQLGAVNSLVQLVRSAEFDEKGTPREVTDTEPINGWFVDLSREGINRLIRLLRHARDKAYGADE